MEYKRFSKDELKKRCIEKTMHYCRSLNSCRYKPDGTYIPGLSFLQIASCLHLTQAQMSRISSGVCCPSAPVFLRLQELHNEYVINENYGLFS